MLVAFMVEQIYTQLLNCRIASAAVTGFRPRAMPVPHSWEKFVDHADGADIGASVAPLVDLSIKLSSILAMLLS